MKTAKALAGVALFVFGCNAWAQPEAGSLSASELEALAERLWADEIDVRRAAIRELEALASEAEGLVETLPDRLESDDREARISALRDLDEFLERVLVIAEDLLEIVLDEERELRWMAASVLYPIVVLAIESVPAVADAYTVSGDEALRAEAEAVFKTAELVHFRNLFVVWRAANESEQWVPEVLDDVVDAIVESFEDHMNELLEDRNIEAGSALPRIAFLLESFLEQTRRDAEPLLRAFRGEPAPGGDISVTEATEIIDSAQFALRLGLISPAEFSNRQAFIASYVEQNFPLEAVVAALIGVLGDSRVADAAMATLADIDRRDFDDSHFEALTQHLLTPAADPVSGQILDLLAALRFDLDEVVSRWAEELASSETTEERNVGMLHALGVVGDDAAHALPAIVAVLDSPSEREVSAAFEALRGIGYSGTEFIRENRAVRDEVAPVLARTLLTGPYDSMIVSLYTAAVDDHQAITRRLVESLEDRTRPDLSGVLRTISDLSDTGYRDWMGAEFRESIARKAIALLQHESFEVIDASADLLSSPRYGSYVTPDHIRPLLADERMERRDIGVRLAAVLGTRSAVLAVDVVRVLERSGDAYSNSYPFERALVDSGAVDDRISVRLAQLIDGGAAGQASTAAAVLEAAGGLSSGALATIESVLNDEDHPHRTQAIRALSGIGVLQPQRAASLLLEYVDADDLGYAAVSALRRLAEEAAMDPGLREAIATAFLPLLDIDDPDSSHLAVLAITGDNNPDVFARVLEASASASDRRSDDIVAALIKLARTPGAASGTARLREAGERLLALQDVVDDFPGLAVALGPTGDSETDRKLSDVLIEIMEAGDSWQRNNAIAALLAFSPGGEAITRRLIAAIRVPQNDDDRDLSMDILEQIAAAPPEILQGLGEDLVRLSTSPQYHVEFFARQALFAMGGSAVPHLARIVQWETANTDSYGGARAFEEIEEFAYGLQADLNIGLPLDEISTRLGDLRQLKEAVAAAEEGERAGGATVYRSGETVTVLENVIRAHENEFRIAQLTSFQYWSQRVSDSPVARGILAYLAFPVAWFGFWVFSPRSLIPLEAALVEVNAKVALVSGTVSYLLVLTPFARSARVLDSWIEHYANEAARKFAIKETVSRRETYLALPLKVNGGLRADAPLDDLRAELQDVFRHREARILIRGEGGSGKTSLACVLAKWQLNQKRTTRFTRHRMIPVLIETEFTDLRTVISVQLKSLLGLGSSPPDVLVGRLLERQRLLVIVDHYSELSSETQGAFKAGIAALNVNSLIVTSRVDVVDLPESTRCTVEPQKVEAGSLFVFLLNYLAQKELSDSGHFALSFIGNATQHHAALHLDRMVEDAPITALLATMFADELIAAIEFVNGEPVMMTKLPDLSASVTDMMSRYIQALHRRDDLVALPQVQRHLRNIAWLCVESTLAPGETRYAAIEAALLPDVQDRKRVSSILNYYVKDLGVLMYRPEDSGFVRFQLDPVAEYLAALFVAETFGSDEARWAKLLSRAASEMASSPDRSWSFLSALANCLRKRGNDYSVARSVTERVQLMVDEIRREAA